MSVAASILEGLKLILMGYFALLAQLGLSEEAAMELYNETRKEFLENNPEKIPEV
jgi:hypothetical protein